MTAADHPWRTLVAAQELRGRLEAAGTSAPRGPIVLLDCGFDLADPGAGERAYAQGHLPGAHYAHLDRDLSGAKTGGNGRHPLPDREAFAARVGAWGIGPGSQVVAYDAQGGPYAARAWWLLRWLGHEAVAVLDGGPAAWLAAGGSHDSEAQPSRGAGDYRVSVPKAAVLAPHIEVEALQSSMARGDVLLVDARAPERYRGDVEPLDPVAGHIPGALNRFFKDNLGADGRFKPPQELRADFAALGLASGRNPGPASVVHQCGSGVTACHNLLAMAHAGIEGTLLYPGSWSEWCADPSRPVARG